MNPTTKRVLMNHMKKRDEEKRREEDERRYGQYEPEDKFRDRRGREHYDNGRYAPMDMGYMRMGDEYYPDASRYGDYRYGGGRIVRNEDEDWVESRQRRDSRGRYTGAKSENGGNYGADSYYPDGPYIPPIYERDRGTRRADMREDYMPMNKIGFVVEGEMERMPNEAHHDYKTAAGYEHTDEMAYRKGSERSSGHGTGNSYAPLTKQMAMEWADSLENEDGTHGPHWSMEQVKQLMAQKGIECDPLDFFLAINLTYSDLSKQFQKYGINKIDAYVDFAKAFWLNDKDFPDKLEKYHAALEM